MICGCCNAVFMLQARNLRIYDGHHNALIVDTNSQDPRVSPWYVTTFKTADFAKSSTLGRHFCSFSSWCYHLQHCVLCEKVLFMTITLVVHPLVEMRTSAVEGNETNFTSPLLFIELLSFLTDTQSCLIS